MRSGEKPEKGLARDKAFNSSDNRIETYQIPARTPPGFDMVSSRFTRASRAQDGGTFNDSNVPCFRRPVILPPAQSQRWSARRGGKWRTPTISFAVSFWTTQSCFTPSFTASGLPRRHCRWATPSRMTGADSSRSGANRDKHEKESEGVFRQYVSS